MDGLRTIVGLILLACLAFGLRVCAVWSPPPESPRALQLLQCLIGTATVLAVAWLGWSLAGPGRGVGWLAALALAVYPPQIHATAYPQAAIWAALTLACLLAVAISPRWQSTRRAPY